MKHTYTTVTIQIQQWRIT